MKKILATLTFSLILLSPLAMALSSQNTGTLNVTVLDQDGALVQEAPVFIYGENRTKFVGGKEIPGTATFSIPAGEYRISSAIIKRSGPYLDRYASHEAHVRIIPGDNTRVILTLRPLDPSLEAISHAELGRMGVPSDIARRLN